MSEITTVGLDLAKNVFPVHATAPIPHLQPSHAVVSNSGAEIYRRGAEELAAQQWRRSASRQFRKLLLLD